MSIPHSTSEVLNLLAELAREMEGVLGKVAPLIETWGTGDMSHVLPDVIAEAMKGQGVRGDLADATGESLREAFRTIRGDLAEVQAYARAVGKWSNASADILHEAAARCSTATKPTFTV